MQDSFGKTANKPTLDKEIVKKNDRSMLVATSLVFKAKENGLINMRGYLQWWEWKAGADWRHPKGPRSTIKGKDNYPVVQVSWDDAMAIANGLVNDYPQKQKGSGLHGEDLPIVFIHGEMKQLIRIKQNAIIGRADPCYKYGRGWICKQLTGKIICRRQTLFMLLSTRISLHNATLPRQNPAKQDNRARNRAQNWLAR